MKMDYICDYITDIFNVNESTVIVTWDTLHILMTLVMFITILVLAWIAKFDPCNKRKNEGRNGSMSAESGIPRCIDADNSLFA